MSETQDETKKSASSSWFVKDMDTDSLNEDAEVLLKQRIQRVEDAVIHKEPDRIPIVPMFTSLPHYLYGTTYTDNMYNYDVASDSHKKFYAEFKPDATTHLAFTSGDANFIAKSKMLDWPGRPGSNIPPLSTYQVHEYSYLEPEEYPELLTDFTGFMLRKYIPRAFPALNGFSDIRFVPSIILNTTPLASLYSPAALEAYKIIEEVGKADDKAAAASAQLTNDLIAIGFPPFMTGAGEVPFDVIGDYFRGTMGALQDQLECPDIMEEVCYMLADRLIESYEYFKVAPLPVKRVFFPMHKGMDGFMSPELYDRLYLKPLLKIIDALVAMDVTPVLYTEGPYQTRLEHLKALPKNKCIVHIEKAEMEDAKRILGDRVCLTGNLPIYMLEYGSKQEVIDECKRLIDICAPGGGYIFDTDGSIDVAKRENIEAMFDTVLTYGKR